MVDLSAIGKAPILRGLTADDLRQLGAIAREQEFLRGARVFTSNQNAECFYIARSGRFALSVLLRALDAHRKLVVEEKAALDAFGWSALVEPRQSIYSADCTVAGAVVAFPRAELEELMTANTRLGEELSRNLNELIGDRVRVLQKLWIDEVEQSMARVRHWSGLGPHGVPDATAETPSSRRVTPEA
jgi:CRP-like cAMP-binding protein